jgi:hypothetical protein
MANPEKKQLEERLAAAATQVLEEMKAAGSTEDDMRHELAEADPTWSCFVVYKRASSDDSFLAIRFTADANADVERLKREIRGEFLNDDNWQHG